MPIFYLTDKERLAAKTRPPPLPAHLRQVTLIDRIRELKFIFDFSATRRVKLLICNKIKKLLRYDSYVSYKDLEFKHCHVKKFRRLEDAQHVWEVLQFTIPHHSLPSLPFQINKDRSFYLCWIPLCEPLNPDNLFESKTMFDGKTDSLFITEYYKKSIRCLFAIVHALKDTRVRCRMDMDSIYTMVCHGYGYYEVAAIFMRFDVQEFVKDDAFDVAQNLKILFDEINKKYSIGEASYRAEFDLLFNNYTLEMNPNIVLANVIFWNKAQRMQFLKKTLEVSKKLGVKLYGEVSKEDWAFKITRHPYMKKLFKTLEPFCREASFQVSPENLMQDFIDVIVSVYDNFAHAVERFREEFLSLGESVEFKDGDEVVDFIQHTFPTLISDLAQQVKKQGWPFVWDELETYCMDSKFLALLGCSETF